MKKVLLVGAIVLAFATSLAAAEMTADELIGKYFAATGGEKNLHNIKSLMMKGSMFAGGMQADVQTFVILPSKSFVQIMMNNIPVQSVGTNEKEAWTKGMTGTFILTGEQKKSAMKQSDIFPLLDYKKRGGKAKFLGKDVVKGAESYKLEFVAADGDTTLFYFDATSFYAVKEKRTDQTVTMSDYKKVGDMVFPFKINVQAAAGQTMLMTLDSIAVNPVIADSLFVVPKDAKPMPEMPKPGVAPDTAKAGEKK